jgi:hypothetical protein
VEAQLREVAGRVGRPLEQRTTLYGRPERLSAVA